MADEHDRSRETDKGLQEQGVSSDRGATAAESGYTRTPIWQRDLSRGTGVPSSDADLGVSTDEEATAASSGYTRTPLPERDLGLDASRAEEREARRSSQDGELVDEA